MKRFNGTTQKRSDGFVGPFLMRRCLMCRFAGEFELDSRASVYFRPNASIHCLVQR